MLFFGGIDNIKKKINKLYYFDFRDSSCISMCNYYINDSIYLPYTPIDIFIWPLSVIVYYNFTCHNEMNKNTENKTLIYYFIMCLISVFLIKIHLAGNGNIGQVVFLTYYCLTALPLVVIFVKGKNSRNLCILLCVAISVASTKRTGTIALILGIFVMLVLDAHIQGSLKEKWKRYMYLFIAICIGSGAVLYLENRSGLEIFDRFSKLSTDGGSGRDVILGRLLFKHLMCQI